MIKLKQGTVNIANSSDYILLSIESSVALPIRQQNKNVETTPFNGSISLTQQQAIMFYLSLYGIPDKFRLKAEGTEIVVNSTDAKVSIRFTDYRNFQRTLYILSSAALLTFLYELQKAIGKEIRYFHHPNLMLEIRPNFFSASTPEGYTVLENESYCKLKFFLSRVVEGSDGRFSFGLEGISFGNNRLILAGRSFSVVKTFPLVGRKVNEVVYLLHLLLNP